MQQGFKPDFEGFAPMMARRQMRKKALFDMPNVIPGMRDPQNGPQSPWGAAGESPDPNNIVEKRWDDVWDKTKRQKNFVRKDNAILKTEDQKDFKESGE
jgi:hypothetical protein